MKISKNRLRDIIAEEITSIEENSPSASSLAQASRSGETRKDISSATGRGRTLIARLQRVISHLGANKIAPNDAVMRKLGQLEAALGIPPETAPAAGPPPAAGAPPEEVR